MLDLPKIVGVPVLAFGPYNGDSATLDISITEGGVFDMPEPMPVDRMDGTVTLEFSGCNAGLVSYEIDSIGARGEIPIERIALDNVRDCESRSAGLID